MTKQFSAPGGVEGLFINKSINQSINWANIFRYLFSYFISVSITPRISLPFFYYPD